MHILLRCHSQNSNTASELPLWLFFIKPLHFFTSLINCELWLRFFFNFCLNILSLFCMQTFKFFKSFRINLSGVRKDFIVHELLSINEMISYHLRIQFFMISIKYRKWCQLIWPSRKQRFLFVWLWIHLYLKTNKFITCRWFPSFTLSSYHHDDFLVLS